MHTDDDMQYSNQYRILTDHIQNNYKKIEYFNISKHLWKTLFLLLKISKIRLDVVLNVYAVVSLLTHKLFILFRYHIFMKDIDGRGTQV